MTDRYHPHAQPPLMARHPFGHRCGVIVAMLAAVVWLSGGVTFAVAQSHADQAVDENDASRLASQVIQLFHARCNDCHGSHLERPDGRFGYVLDLPRVAANEDMVEPGDAAGSPLWWLIEDGHMPPADSDVAALSEAEMQTIRQWIEAGAPPAPADVVAAMESAAPAVTVAPITAKEVDRSADPRAAAPLGRRLVKWLGNFHPASVHFPIALLIAAALVELWSMRRPSAAACNVVRFCLWAGALTAVAAAALGWANAMDMVVVGSRARLLDAHRLLGTALAAAALVTLAADVVRQRRPDSSAAILTVRVALFLLAVAVTVTGFLGGALVYGLDHYKW